MPTVILLDVSLSMSRPAGGEVLSLTEDVVEVTLRKHLAAEGCCLLLDHFAHYCKLEFTSLVIFSSLNEVKMPFTRDFEALKKAVLAVDEYDKTNVEVGLMGAAQHILEEWGNGTPCQIVMVTDGNLGTTQQSLAKAVMSPGSKGPTTFPFPFPFPAKLNIVCIASKDEPCFQASRPLWQRLVDLNGEGNIYVPLGPLNSKTVAEAFEELIKNNFSSYMGTLFCGNLSSPVILSPPPQPYNRHHDFEVVKVNVNDTIRVCGFLNIADISSPPVFSRHLVLPLSPKSESVAPLKTDSGSDTEEGGNDEGRIPSFCVLLHGGLKREGLVAFCQVSENWYGILYSFADSKKKSNLMLSLFFPGIDGIPWLGKFTNLGPASMAPKDTAASQENGLTFPIKVQEKKSYGQNCVVWVRPGGLHSDIQKVLKHAKKLPDKTQSFFKELNRIRRAALSYGFPSLLEGLANVLERECMSLPVSAHPNAYIQLQQAYEALRSHRDTQHTIQAAKVSSD